MIIRNSWFSVVAISSSMFMRMLGVFIALPVIAYGAQELSQSSALLIGVAVGIHGLSQSTLQIPFGYLSDKWQRKPVLIFGLALFLCGSLVAAFSTNIWGMILGRFLQGCGAIGSVSLAFIIDRVPQDKQAIAIASFGASIGAAFIISLFLGPIIYNLYTLKGVFLLGAVFALIAILLISLVPGNAEGKTNAFNYSILESLKSAFTDGTKLPFCFATVFIIHAALATYFTALPALIGKVDYSLYLYAICIAIAIIGLFPIKKYGDSITKLSILLMALAQLSVAFGMGKMSFCVFLITFIILETLLPSEVAKNCREGQRGISLGIYTTFQFLGVFLGGSCSGFVLNYLDARILPLLASGLTFSLLATIILYTKLFDRYTVLVEH
ncbi:MAG: MFS transporter [Francisellaceae bacterium]|jgi:MFS family permease|nr:MFS transporter [Francisellaceae bacterium]MBT6207909.1 MFS transporter [Francisellaceae bacterium]MBT6539091.1 MFS transporter [Francisellaceae bacterium]